MKRWLLILGIGLTAVPARVHAQPKSVEAAQELGKARAAVQVQPDGLYICEAEEFWTSVEQATVPGWQAKRFGKNYCAATFANSFLSRKAFLGAPEQCEPSTASRQVNVADS